MYAIRSYYVEAPLGQGHAHHVLAELVARVGVALPDQVEGGRDHLALELGERGLGLLSLSALRRPALTLALPVRSVEGADVQEVDVAGDRVRATAPPVVPA